jgi:hypothetical protein
MRRVTDLTLDFLYEGVHLSERGHKAMAEEIFRMRVDSNNRLDKVGK